MVLVVSLILAAILPPADDELYYWCWAKDLQFSYYDHPPMVAYLIRASTEIFGDTVFGLRVPACLANAFLLWIIRRLSRTPTLLPWIVCTPLFTLGSVIVTPDAPLLMFWAAYLWWLVEIHCSLPRHPAGARSKRSEPSFGLPWSRWILGGVLLGAGILSKYTMALAVPAGFASFLLLRLNWRKWLPGYLLHGMVAFVVASPILIYNIQNNFTPLIFQWQHSMGGTPENNRHFFEFAGAQILLFGTLPFFLLPWVLWNFRRLAKVPRLRVCCCLYAIPWSFFLLKATNSHVEANWALVSFIAFWPLASVWYDAVSKSTFWRWSMRSAFIPSIVSVLLLTLHLLHPLPIIPTQGDRIYLQFSKVTVAREISETIRIRGENLPVYAPTYQWTSLLRFQGLNTRQIEGLTRPSHFTQPPRHLDQETQAYVVAENRLPEKFASGFAIPELIQDYPLVVRGTSERTVHLFLYTKQPPHISEDDTGVE